jgi:hypothetical protein
MIDGYIREGWDGKKETVYGEHSWEGFLAPEDTREPGRVRAFSVISDGHPVCIELGPDDILTFVRRTRLLEQADGDTQFVGTRVIFGKRKDPSAVQGAFYVVWPNGAVQVTKDFNHG